MRMVQGASVVVLLAVGILATEVRTKAGPPGSTNARVTVSFADRVGDKLVSDGRGTYDDGIDGGWGCSIGNATSRQRVIVEPGTRLVVILYKWLTVSPITTDGKRERLRMKIALVDIYISDRIYRVQI